MKCPFAVGQLSWSTGPRPSYNGRLPLMAYKRQFIDLFQGWSHVLLRKKLSSPVGGGFDTVGD
jgi:hypothetical protein